MARSTDLQATHAYFFGCKYKDNVGHALHDSQGNSDYRTPSWFPPAFALLDGDLVPDPKNQGGPEGLAKHHQSQQHIAESANSILGNDGWWSAIAFLDRSGDSRSGSNTVFIVSGKHDFEAVVEISKKAFPKIWERFPFEVRLWVPQDNSPPESRR